MDSDGDLDPDPDRDRDADTDPDIDADVGQSSRPRTEIRSDSNRLTHVFVAFVSSLVYQSATERINADSDQ
ncbi:hypothetical protein C484_16494 [Natrialba taiwanensis DSM 12281]|uniref:Uncharacterized protein n=1 Tax=Natrialba taiwanensis DSM 12281 TaxID=1230458 RepID=L9ZSB5_9EURY|nr:hypothetical protein C484_16494 [Natrialba taiwanensis DSM 12281]